MYDQDPQIAQDPGNRRGILKISGRRRPFIIEHLRNRVDGTAAATDAFVFEIGHYLNAANSRQKVKLLP